MFLFVAGVRGRWVSRCLSLSLVVLVVHADILGPRERERDGAAYQTAPPVTITIVRFWGGCGSVGQCPGRSVRFGKLAFLQQNEAFFIKKGVHVCPFRVAFSTRNREILFHIAQKRPHGQKALLFRRTERFFDEKVV